jgi:hypothetical protein
MPNLPITPPAIKAADVSKKAICALCFQSLQASLMTMQKAVASSKSPMTVEERLID